MQRALERTYGAGASAAPSSATLKVATLLHGEIAPFRLISPRTEHPPQAAVRGSSPTRRMILLDLSPAEITRRGETTVFRICLKETAKLDAVMLLARPLSAASPDARHPGKAGKISGESSLSPGDYSRLSWGQKPSDFRKPQRGRRKLSVSSNGVISPGAGPGYSVPWWGLG